MIEIPATNGGQPRPKFQTRTVARLLLVAVIVLSLGPLVFFYGSGSGDLGSVAPPDPKGRLIHFGLEWTAVCIALFAGILSLLYYIIRRNGTVSVIGTALFWSGVMDAFHALASAELIPTAASSHNFIPFTWALSRIFHTAILALGTVLLVFNKRLFEAWRLSNIAGWWILFGGIAMVSMYISLITTLPDSLYPDRVITRPYDLLPLAFLALALVMSLRLYREQKSLFTGALLVSLLPEAMTQVYMAFGSTQIFDVFFNVGHSTKILAYSVPLGGLCFDYIVTHRREAKFQEELAIMVQNKTRDIERQKNLLESIIHQATEGIVYADNNYEFIIWNDFATKLLGTGKTETEPSDWQDTYGLFYPDGTVVPEDEIPLVQAIRFGRTLTGLELMVKNPQLPEAVYLTVAARPLKGANGEIYGGIVMFTDITQIKKREAEVIRSNKELENFAYVTSHDLQEPLRKIKGFAEVLNRQASNLDEMSSKYLNYIVDGAERMQGLIEDILQYSRVGRAEFEPEDINLEEVVRDIWSLYDSTVAETGAQLYTGRLPIIRAQRSGINTLFQNLMGNALKFRREGVPPHIRVEASSVNGSWEVMVQDNGIGINPKFNDRIFKIFQRLHTREEFPGTGIGLAISQKIVERHAGTIWVEPAPEQGTCFKFRIPRALGDL